MISYERHVPSIPDKYIKPYVDFINHVSHLDAHCDFDLTDSYECDVYACLYEFRYFLRHQNGRVTFSLAILPKEEDKFDSLGWLDELVAKFNKSHSTIFSYNHRVMKRFFLKKTYILNFYYLSLELHHASENKMIASAIRDFYSDLIDFFRIKPFDKIIPKANYPEESGYSFINYLEDEVVLLEAYEKGIFNNLLMDPQEPNSSEKLEVLRIALLEARQAGIAWIQADTTTFVTDDPDCYSRGIKLAIQRGRAEWNLLKELEKEFSWFKVDKRTSMLTISPNLNIKFKLSLYGFHQAVANSLEKSGIDCYVDVNWKE